MDAQDQPSPMVLAQRVRNNIIGALELMSSHDMQLDYQRRVPIADVPAEVLCAWSDWVDNKRIATFTEPVFVPEEREAIQAFHEIFAGLRLPAPMPALAELQKSVPWKRLQEAALVALQVFAVRGEFDESREVFRS